MTIDLLVVGAFQANCYVLGCPQTSEALVIDPGDEPRAIEQVLTRRRLTPKAYLLTHGHIDHVGAATPLRSALGGEILIHEGDLFLYEHASRQAQVYGLSIPETVPPDRTVADGERISWGAFSGTILHTPGHSPGGICLQIEGRRIDTRAVLAELDPSVAPRGRGHRDPASAVPNPALAAVVPDWIFTGDTLFQGSIGRTDLPGGSMRTLFDSLRRRILTLADPTLAACGHGPLTSIGSERHSNPFLQELT